MNVLTANMLLLSETLAKLARPRSVHVSRTTHRVPFPPINLVLVDGDYYHASPEALASLRSGWTPEELGLELIEEED